MKRISYDRIYIYFHTDHGEVAVTYLNPRPDLTLNEIKTIAERLIPIYRTRKGVRLKAFKKAVKKHVGETEIV